ncbi:hypothetical protein ACIRG5_42335 [Lentzea sp. NPDC102401]|uniref:hypothetical protein n=1 Tax=Lentzea sp. NPDC102401 TaxID=3364128 RepID=UPI003823E2AC
MSLHNRKLKVINLTIGGNSYECQISNWELQNNTEDGNKIYSYCPDGEDREETDPDWALSLTLYSDWRVNGISDYFMTNDGEDAAFSIVHHPGTVDEQVQWTGNLRIKAPNVGGEVKTTETQTIVLQCIGKPVYARA